MLVHERGDQVQSRTFLEGILRRERPLHLAGEEGVGVAERQHRFRLQSPDEGSVQRNEVAFRLRTL